MTYKRYYNFGKIVFITIVTYNRMPFLLNNIELIRTAFRSVKYKYSIIAGVVLKDHMHLLLEPNNMNEIPLIISFFKQYFSKNISSVGLDPLTDNISASRKNKNERGIWQRRYYDHIIRDEKDFNRHLDYIHYNPMKHYKITPKDWEYSSFKKFAEAGMYEENWCNFGDVNGIEELDLE